jgi:hypothetical protein
MVRKLKIIIPNDATCFEASTSTSHVRVLGDEDFIIVHQWRDLMM